MSVYIYICSTSDNWSTGGDSLSTGGNLEEGNCKLVHRYMYKCSNVYRKITSGSVTTGLSSGLRGEDTYAVGE